MTELRFFGSVARGQDTHNSDLDLLVRVSPGSGLLALGRVIRELQSLLHVPVDVVSESGVKARVYDSIYRDLVHL